MSPEESHLSTQLPLFQLRDFDVLLNKGVPIGIDSDYPSELRLRLSAASISFQMGNKSLDYVIKRYLNDVVYEETPPDRLDKRIALALKQEVSRLDKLLSPLEPLNPVLGHVVAKWTFLRVPFSFDLALTCAQRGALFECLAIVRMILEQIAWALDIRFRDDFDGITSRRTYQSIGCLNLVHPTAGRFYGWLSAHAHWTYDAHIKTFESGDGKIGMRLATPLYKAQALGAMLVLFVITNAAYRCIFRTLSKDEVVRNTTTINAYALVGRLAGLAPEDVDLQLLLTMVETQNGDR